MAMGGGGGGRRLKGFSEINVTPLVDVMLVLLVVFMVTAPLLTAGLRVELPNVQAQETPTRDTKLVVTVTKEEKILFGELTAGQIVRVDVTGEGSLAEFTFEGIDKDDVVGEPVVAPSGASSEGDAPEPEAQPTA